jgi:hypothetical protein
MREPDERTDGMTITEFLTARLDEDEAVASQLLTDLRSQIEAEWQGQEDDQGPMTPDRMLSAQLWRNYDGQQRWRSFARGQQIARLASPDRVLAEVAAKRAIVELHSEDALACYWSHDSMAHHEPGEACDTLCALALPYADHSDYDEAWRPREAWRP